MNRLPLITALLLPSIFSTGCGTLEAANEYLAERTRVSEEETLNQARVSCEKYGFTKGTERFAACLQTEVNQAKLREAAAASSTTTFAPKPQEATPELKSLFPPSPAPTTTTCRQTIFGTLECTTR
jgi:hypothetical protein